MGHKRSSVAVFLLLALIGSVAALSRQQQTQPTTPRRLGVVGAPTHRSGHQPDASHLS